MKITRLEASTHRIPATVPLLREPVMREIVFVRVETDAGVIGYGLTGPIQRFAVRDLINREIAPLLVGKDPLTTERHWYDLFYRLNPLAQTGAWSSAVSAVDIALWDIKGKHLGQPVWRLLGGYSATVYAYITFGLLEYTREQLVEAAKHSTAQGHDKLKLVVAINGARDLAEDAARVRADRAIRDHVVRGAGVRERRQPNVVYVGGYTEAVKVAAMAQSYNLPIANGGGWPHHNMHLIAGVANGWRVEFHVPMWVTGEMIFRDPPKPVRGTVTLAETPGLGLEPKEEVFKDTREPCLLLARNLPALRSLPKATPSPREQLSALATSSRRSQRLFP